MGCVRQTISSHCDGYRQLRCLLDLRQDEPISQNPPISRVTQPANLSQPPLSLSGEKEGWARGKSFIKPLEGLCASCHLPEGLVSWLGLPPWYGMVGYGMVWYGMVGVPTTSLGHRQHQSAEGEKRTIWLPTTCTDAHIVHNSLFAKLHHKRQKKR